MLRNQGHVGLPRVSLLILMHKCTPWAVGVGLVLLLFLLFLLLITVALL